MMPAIRKFIDLLNQYANLLLVIITALYAGLTWRTLGALRVASFREQEAQHLQQIKDRIVQPIIFWIDVLSTTLTGGAPELLTVSSYPEKPRRVSHRVSEPFIARRRLILPDEPDAPDDVAAWTSMADDPVVRFLYNEAKRNHFPELLKFDQLLQDMRELVATFLSFANECSTEITGTEIPSAPRAEDQRSMPEWNPPLLTVAWIQSLLMGQTQLRAEARSSQGFYLLTTTQNQEIAKGAQPERLELWGDKGFEHMRDRWKAMGLTERTRSLLKDAETVRDKIEQILFIQSIGVTCELVSGRKKGRHWWSRN